MSNNQSHTSYNSTCQDNWTYEACSLGGSVQTLKNILLINSFNDLHCGCWGLCILIHNTLTTHHTLSHFCIPFWRAAGESIRSVMTQLDQSAHICSVIKVNKNSKVKVTLKRNLPKLSVNYRVTITFFIK